MKQQVSGWHVVVLCLFVSYCQAEMRREDGKLVSSYCFALLTVQEFLAALKIMTSQDVSETQLKKR